MILPWQKRFDTSMIDPTSKMALKLTCLQQAGGDVRKASELYTFLAEGMETLPEFPVAQPSLIQQAQQTIGNVFGWVKENQGEIAQLWGMVQQMRGGAVPPPIPPTPIDIPPLPAQ
jgi:hypothetical protein